MTELKLSEEDARILRDTLTGYLSDLRMQISATDLHDFKKGLKDRQSALNRVLDQLPGASEDKDFEE